MTTQYSLNEEDGRKKRQKRQIKENEVNATICQVITTQQEGNHTWYWRSSQLLPASKATGFGEDPTTTTLLNHHNL